MQLQSICNIGSRRRAIAGAVAALFVLLPFWTGTRAAPAAAEPRNSSLNQQRANLYTVINLGPERASGELNERGQVAFTDYNFPDTVSRFFDGDRIWPIGSLDGGFTSVAALNNHGVVVGASATAAESGGQAYAWTLAGGIRALSGTPPSAARDVNDRNEIVGWVSAPGVAARAIRWNLAGGTTPLGPLPASQSEGIAINNGGYSTGYTTGASGAPQPHAAFWDRAGAQTDLSPAAGGAGYGLRINERNEVAGLINEMPFAPWKGLFWSSGTGTVRIDAGIDYRPGDLNNRGELVGSGEIGEQRKAFQWTLGRGVVRLPVESALFSHAVDINDRGEIAGWTLRSTGGGNIWRAVLWPSFTAMPVDLNTRLSRAPAGLQLLEALAINDNGAILANSNAGLVLLRPGQRGTDAPVLGPIAGLPIVVQLGQDLALTINFVDNARTQTHKASVVWADGCASPAPTVTQAGGFGQVRLQHRFCAVGYHAVKVVVTDSGGRSTELQRHVFVEVPGLAALSGEGALAGGTPSTGHGHQHAPLRFALWAPLGGISAAGTPVVRFSGPFHFRSGAVTRATSTGAGRARVEGTGRLNGRDGYRFVLEAVDGGATQDARADRLRVRVTHADAATGAEVVDYDNGDNGATQLAAGANRTVVAEGGLTLRH